MAIPVQGAEFTKGTIRPLSYILGYNCNGLTNAAKLLNLTNNNNTAYNNAQITVVDNATGTVSISHNMNESGKMLIQFKSNDANNTFYSPTFTFKVSDPIASI